MADHNPQHGRRPHFHRGRRGPDRRGPERRSLQRDHSPDAPREATNRDGGVDVEQIMREIRSRIAQRHGIELTNQQIQELAARRLEAILEPRNVKPQLLEQLRRSAAATEVPASPALETYEFEDTTLFETHRGIVRFFRKLFLPFLKLLFNPTPLIQALNRQSRINKELAARELEREQRQSEWNALQFELLQRMVVETSRVSLEMQALTARVESLGAKVDFNERRVRSLESPSSAAPSRPQPRHQEAPATMAAVTAEGVTTPETLPLADGTSEGTRKRRRRRRGRRSGGSGTDAQASAGLSATAEEEVETGDAGDLEEDEPVTLAVPTATIENGAATSVEAPAAPAATPFEPVNTAAAAELQPPPPAPAQPTPPPDEPMPQDPTDRHDPGPVDR